MALPFRVNIGRPVKPFTVPELLVAFASLNIDDERAVVDWCQTYGEIPDWSRHPGDLRERMRHLHGLVKPLIAKVLLREELTAKDLARLKTLQAKEGWPTFTQHVKRDEWGQRCVVVEQRTGWHTFDGYLAYLVLSTYQFVMNEKSEAGRLFAESFKKCPVCGGAWDRMARRGQRSTACSQQCSRELRNRKRREQYPATKPP